MITGINISANAAQHGIEIVAAPYAPYSLMIASSSTTHIIHEYLANVPFVDRAYTFVLQQFNVGFAEGMRLRAAVPDTNDQWIEGVVISFGGIDGCGSTTNEITLLIDLVSGNGVYDEWLIFLAGEPGPQGPQGPKGVTGPRGPFAGPQGPRGDKGEEGEPGTILGDGEYANLDALTAAFPNGPTPPGLGFLIHEGPPSAAPDMRSLFEDEVPWYTYINTSNEKLGTRFRATEPVWIRGVSYWNIPGMGAVRCELWDIASQNLLASKVAPAHEVDEWRTVIFDQAISIVANQTFIASFLPITPSRTGYSDTPPFNRPGLIVATGSASGPTPPEFLDTQTYVVGDLMIRNGWLYEAIADNGPGFFDPDDWQLHEPGGIFPNGVNATRFFFTDVVYSDRRGHINDNPDYLGGGPVAENEWLAVWDRYGRAWHVVANLRGPTGEQGEDHPPTDIPGPVGPIGPQGLRGPRGVQGPQGPQGFAAGTAEFNTVIAQVGASPENFAWRDGSRPFTGIVRALSPSADSNDATIPNTNWSRARTWEGLAGYLPLSGGNVNYLTVGGTPVVRSSTGNQVWMAWGSPWVHLQVDNTGMGGLWHTGNFNPGTLWSVWNFNPGDKVNTWDVNAYGGNRADYWNTINQMRMVYAGIASVVGNPELHVNMREPWHGAVCTGAGGTIIQNANNIWALIFRYIQFMYGHGHWVTVGYA